MSTEDKDEAEDGSQSIFDLFEPPPDGGPGTFGKVPVVRGEDASDEETVELSQKMAAAEAEAAGLQHWTEPATGKMPAAFEATRSQRIESEALRPSWQGDDGGWDGPDLTEALESIDELPDEEIMAEPEPASADAIDSVKELGWDRDEPAQQAVEQSASDDLDPSEGRLAPRPDPIKPDSEATAPDRPGKNPTTVISVDDSESGRVDSAAAAFKSPSKVSLEEFGDETVLDGRKPPAPFTVSDSPSPTTGLANTGLADKAEASIESAAPVRVLEEQPIVAADSQPTARNKAVPAPERPSVVTGVTPAVAPPEVPAVRPRKDDSADTSAASVAPTAPGLFGDGGGGVFARESGSLDAGGSDAAAPRPSPSSELSRDAYPSLAEDDGPGRNVPQAIAVGVALGAVVLVAMALGPVYILGVVALVALLAVVELYNAMRVAGLRPANLLGIFAAVALPLAAYYRGDSAFTLVLALSLVFGMLWYIVGADSERPVLNLSLTLLGVVWIGGLGAFAGLILRNDRGVQYLASTILMVVVFDTLAYFGGRAFGSRPFHRASPKKTWEGTVVGFLGSIFTGFALWATPLSLTDMWSESLTAALALGALVGIAAPIGDLAESLVKRDLGIKDMGSILPGHGGVLDRIDGLLFALPTAYYLALSLRFVWE